MRVQDGGLRLLSAAGVAWLALGASPVTTSRRDKGQDLSPLYLETRSPAWRDEFFYEHPTVTSKDRIPSSRAVIGKNWKFIEWPEFDHQQLFDLKNDPGELRNLAEDPAHATEQKKMRQRLDAWRQRVR